jgi:RNA polymerase sigma factor (sigma-70 family)
MGSDPLQRPEPLIRRVYAYVAYRVGDGPDAEDITSDTFERAFRYRDRFDGRRGDPAAWLIGIARRCIADHYGARAVPVDDPAEDVAPGDLAADSAVRLDLLEAVSLLSPRDRELVALRYGADLTARQIGELLELKTNAVEVALHRALQTLRSHLEGEGPAEPRPAGGKTTLGVAE